MVNGIVFSNVLTNAETVQDFLREQGVTTTKHDFVYPDFDTVLTPGISVHVDQARDITVFVDGEEQRFFTHEDFLEQALASEHITVDALDLLSQPRDTFLSRQEEITITRVVIKEEVEKQDIKYKKKIKDDNKLSWRKKEITQKGKNGVREIVYRVAYHDGVEVNRSVLSDTVTKEPVTEITSKGIYVKLGKKHTGLGTWYAHTGTMAAANPWLPMGSYVKVTNKANNKSVIVKINDRGPFGPNRIIDLDRVAFEKIASLGAGVIDVKMEEIEN